jgi:peroxiredoxin (alkyl hydroperoxide reductase subunit C)
LNKKEIVPPPGSCGPAKDRVEKPAADTTVLDWFMFLKKCPSLCQKKCMRK